MKLDWDEFNRGVEDFQKEAYWGEGVVNGVKNLGGFLDHPVQSVKNIGSGIIGKAVGSIGEGISNNIGKVVAGIGAVAAPIIGLAASGAFGGNKNNQPAPGAPAQPSNILTSHPGEVNTLSAPKTAGLIDPNMVRSVLTTKAINGITGTLAGQPSQPQAAKEPSETQLLLEAKHPEMKKLLADEATRAYLESLLKEDSNNG